MNGTRKHPAMNVCHLVMDWDSTLTTSDTLSTLAKIGYDAHARRSSQEVLAGLQPWSCFVDAYLADYTKHQDEYLPTKEDRMTIAEESTWLASLKQVELNSWQRVNDAGIFSAIEKGDIERGVEDAFRDGRVKMRSGWESFLSIADGFYPGSLNWQGSIRDRPEWDFDTAIISVNWSAKFIESCLTNALLGKCELPLHKLSLFTNELSELIEYRQSPVGLDSYRPVRTSADKLRVLAGIPWEHQDPNRLRGPPQPYPGSQITIYVGDSLTDFDCLLAADMGFCIRDIPMSMAQTELLEALERVGVEVKALASIQTVSDMRMMRSRRIMWWTDELSSISRWVLTLLQV